MPFFEPLPPEPPEPEIPAYKWGPPLWDRPSEAILGASVPVTALLAKNDRVAIAIANVRAYPNGFAFTLLLLGNPMAPRSGREQGLLGMHGHRLMRSARLGFEFADGTRVATGGNPMMGPNMLMAGTAKDDAGVPTAPVLRPTGGRGSNDSWYTELWCYPLPPAGPITVYSEWTEAGIDESMTVIDGDAIRDAFDARHHPLGAAMTDPVIQTVPLGFQWATVDPFLFCVHHLDRYPEANEHMGPNASLAARDLGMDFEGADGWRMYHGSTIPGFPQHPHRGFETITFVRQGYVDHSDSLGATARFGRGDVQWLTAGKGIVHCEMFPLLDRNGPNPCELFQIWCNLPADDKMVEPYFTMLWSEDLPRHIVKDGEGRATEITIIAGELAGLQPPAPPPDSWASRPESDLAIWHVVCEPGAQCELPPATGPVTLRTLYVFEGGVHIGEHNLEASVGASVHSHLPVTITAGPYGAEVLMLQARPIGEPVAQYGPFVMNDKAGIEQAFADYRSTGFGGWPWPTDDPVHGRDAGRFAQHPDGQREDR